MLAEPGGKSIILSLLAAMFLVGFLAAAPLVQATECPGAQLCRAGGALLHKPNSNAI